MTAFSLLVDPKAIRYEPPWYTPQYAIPLLGMILGNPLNGISLGLNRLGEDLLEKRGQVETLAPGAVCSTPAASSSIPAWPLQVRLQEIEKRISDEAAQRSGRRDRRHTIC